MILLGQQLKILTEHKNITCKNFNTNRLLWWRLILEGCSTKIEYISGEKNIFVDLLSR